MKTLQFIFIMLISISTYSQLKPIIIEYDYVNICEYRKWHDQDTCNYWHKEKYMMIMEINEYGEPIKVTLVSKRGVSVFETVDADEECVYVYENRINSIDFKTWDAYDEEHNKLIIYFEQCNYLELRYDNFTVGLADEKVLKMLKKRGFDIQLES